MNIVKKHNWGEVTAYELGYGPFFPPVMNVHFYCVKGVMIDTGQHRMARTFREIISDESIEMALLTHHHEDHSGNAALLKKLTGVPVYGSTGTVKKMRTGSPILPYQKLIWGRAEPLEVEPLPEVITVNGLCLEPVATPGHSKDHTVYFEKERGWLFSGDLFIGPRIKYFRADERMLNTINSLKRALSLDFDALFCCHNPQPTGGKLLLAAKLAFLEDFFGTVCRLSTEGLSKREILHRMGREYWPVRIFTTGNVGFIEMINSALRDCGTLSTTGGENNAAE